MLNESMWLLFQKRCAKHDRLRVKDWQIEVDIVKMRDLAKHQIDVTWVSWRISSTATPLFVQQQLHHLNTLRPRQNDRHCEDHIFKRIFLIEIYCICIRNSLKYIYVSRVQLSSCQGWFRWCLGAEQATSHYLKQYWHGLLTHICVTRPQWINTREHWGSVILVTGYTTDHA